MRIALAVACLAAAGWAQPVPVPPTPEDLFRAVRINDLATIRTGVIRKTAATARDARGATLLMHAAAFGSVDAVRILLDGGVPVNARNAFDATALLWGAGDPVKTKLLVAEGADVNAASKLGRTPLMVAAAEAGNSETVSLLLAKGANANAVASAGSTALMAAATAGDLRSTLLLLDAGADPNHQDGLTYTPLMAASMGANPAVTQALLAKGADPKKDLTKMGTVKFGEVQMKHMTALMLGAPFNSPEMETALAGAGAAVNAHDVRGLTPLMLAAATERSDAARIDALLRAGADVSAKDATGATALDWAERYGYADTIAALTKAGAKEADHFAPPVRPETKPRAILSAVEAALGPVTAAGREFFKQSGCVGCHHQPMALAAIGAAKAGGAHVDSAAAQDFIKMIEGGWNSSQEPFLERMDSPGAPDDSDYFVWALLNNGYQPTALTDVVALNVAGQQTASGSWHVGDISRAPLQESDIGRTARSLLILEKFGPPALKEQMAARIERARAYLSAAKAVTNEDQVMQIAGLQWAGANPVTLSLLAKRLLVTQRADGGWAQNPNLESDAYATGETLWMLHETGLAAAESPAYRKGVEYLLKTQWPDGTWYVRSRAPKIQPYFESGFPYHHDQWVSAAGTAWAVLGLAPALKASTAH